MFKLVVHKDKITRNIFNEILNKWEEQIEIDESLMLTRYFNDEVEISEGVTFEDFMNILERFETDINFCFAAYSQCIPLKTYLKEMRTDITHDISIVQVEFFRKGEISASELSLSNSMRGFMSEESAECLGEEIEKPLSIDSYHVNALKRAVMSLNDNVIIIDYGIPSSCNNEENVVFDGFGVWTLHDLISTLLSVITKNGTPEERNSVNDCEPYSLERVAKSKDDIQMWLDLFNEELEEKKKNKVEAIYDERYEEALILNHNIFELEEKVKDLIKQMSLLNKSEKTV